MEGDYRFCWVGVIGLKRHLTKHEAAHGVATALMHDMPFLCVHCALLLPLVIQHKCRSLPRGRF